VQGGGAQTAEVGRVTVVFWSGDQGTALALAELADRQSRWPGIPDPPIERLRLIYADTEERFDSVTGGRVPEWGAAATFPAARTIVLRRTRDLPRVLRHELAHLVLHSVVRRVPRWFDEGYAAYAAGEWGRVEALRVNWALLRGAAPSLREIDRRIRRGGASDAEASYALATTAVLALERLGGERGLEPLLTRLGRTGDFDLALRATHQLTLGQFEDRWRREIRRRYGWLLVFSSLTVFWIFAGLLLAALWLRRRHHDRERREALNDGWFVPEEQWNIDS
jgi:hypothetical protein